MNLLKGGGASPPTGFGDQPIVVKRLCYGCGSTKLITESKCDDFSITKSPNGLTLNYPQDSKGAFQRYLVSPVGLTCPFFALLFN